MAESTTGYVSDASSSMWDRQVHHTCDASGTVHSTITRRFVPAVGQHGDGRFTDPISLLSIIDKQALERYDEQVLNTNDLSEPQQIMVHGVPAFAADADDTDHMAGLSLKLTLSAESASESAIGDPATLTLGVNGFRLLDLFREAINARPKSFDTAHETGLRLRVRQDGSIGTEDPLSLRVVIAQNSKPGTAILLTISAETEGLVTRKTEEADWVLTSFEDDEDSLQAAMEGFSADGLLQARQESSAARENIISWMARTAGDVDPSAGSLRRMARGLVHRTLPVRGLPTLHFGRRGNGGDEANMKR